MALTLDKFLIPDGAPSVDKQKTQSTGWGVDGSGNFVGDVGLHAILNGNLTVALVTTLNGATTINQPAGQVGLTINSAGDDSAALEIYDNGGTKRIYSSNNSRDLTLSGGVLTAARGIFTTSSGSNYSGRFNGTAGQTANILEVVANGGITSAFDKDAYLNINGATQGAMIDVKQTGSNDPSPILALQRDVGTSTNFVEFLNDVGSGQFSVNATGSITALGVCKLGNVAEYGADATNNAAKVEGLAGRGTILMGNVADGATAVSAKIDNNVELTTAGALLLSVRNNGTEKFAVDKDGDVESVSGVFRGTSQNVRIYPTYNGNVRLEPSGGSFQPSTGADARFFQVDPGTFAVNNTGAHKSIELDGTFGALSAKTMTDTMAVIDASMGLGNGNNLTYNGSRPMAALALTPTINVNTASTEGYSLIYGDVTETQLSATATNYLIDLKVGGTSKFRVGTDGVIVGSGVYEATITDDTELQAAHTELLSGNYTSGLFYVKGDVTTTDINTTKDIQFVGIPSDNTKPKLSLPNGNDWTVDGDNTLEFRNLDMAWTGTNTNEITITGRYGRVIFDGCDITTLDEPLVTTSTLGGADDSITADVVIRNCNIVHSSTTQGLIVNQIDNTLSIVVKLNISVENSVIDGWFVSHNFSSSDSNREAITNVFISDSEIKDSVGNGSWDLESGVTGVITNECNVKYTPSSNVIQTLQAGSDPVTFTQTVPSATLSPVAANPGGSQTLWANSGDSNKLYYGASEVGGATTYPLLAPDGSGAAPSFSFANSTNTGAYLPSAGSLAFAASGTLVMTVQSSVVTITKNVNVSESSAVNNPTIYLEGDASTGFYRPAASELAVTVLSTQRCRFHSTGVSVTGVLTSTSLSSGDITGTGNLDIGASVTLPFEGVAINTTLDDTHYTVDVDASGAARTITLPAATGKQGRIYNVLKNDSSGNSVTIDTTGGDTINGAASKALTTQYSGLTLQSDGGTDWRII